MIWILSFKNNLPDSQALFYNFFGPLNRCPDDRIETFLLSFVAFDPLSSMTLLFLIHSIDFSLSIVMVVPLYWPHFKIQKILDTNCFAKKELV